TITGPISFCPDLTVYTYSIAPVANTANYIWTVPTNCTLLSGQGTISISVRYIAVFTSGSITVKARNCIGTSNAKSLSVAKQAKPANPGTVTGPAAICIGSSYNYSIAAIAGATSYNW